MALTDKLTAIADAIRAKTGTTGGMTLEQMPSAIAGITGGGGGSVDGYATVTFMNGDEVLFSRLVLKGDDCPDPYVQKRIELPTKESTAQYDYTFNGWAVGNGWSASNTALKGITEDKTLYAAFAESVRKYTVTLYDEDGTLLYTETDVPYGSMPSYVPTKEGAGFAGWTPKTPVTGDTSYTATWSVVLASGAADYDGKGTAQWSVDANYVLTFSGSGSVFPKADTMPWSEYTSQITALVVEEGITAIGKAYILENDTALTSVTLPSTFNNINGSAFSGCTNIQSLHVPSLSWLLNRGNTCYLKDVWDKGNGAVIYVNGEPIVGDIVIPDGVTTLAQYVFSKYKHITSITIPESVTSVGLYAFANCPNLTTATILCSGNGWGDKVFEGCTKLASVNFGDNLVKVPYGAFYGCSGLTAVELPINVAEICNAAFYNTKLTSITIPSSVTKIGSSAISPPYGVTFSSAIFEDTEGWKAGTTALASSDLADPATAATYLTKTYPYSTWTKS